MELEENIKELNAWKERNSENRAVIVIAIEKTSEDDEKCGYSFG